MCVCGVGGGGGMSILRNVNVACLCRLVMPMSPVKFKKWPCRMSIIIINNRLGIDLLQSI